MKTCTRWRSRSCFTSGLYTTENSGRSDLSDIGCECVEGVSTVVSGIVSELPSDKSFILPLGMEMGIFDELYVPREPESTTGGRERPWNIRRQNFGVDGEAVGAIDAFRLVEGVVSVEIETLLGINFFLQSWQIFFRSESSSSESVVTTADINFQFD